jgi:hypothetical protein
MVGMTFFHFEPQALDAIDALEHDDPRTFDRIFDLLELLAADPVEAKVRRGNYVSTRDVWGTHVPGTDYTVYWRTDPEVFVVYLVRED